MGQQQSKDELLYRQVRCGNIERIKALRNEGAGLECIDRKGKTPLIVACMKPELHNVARTLIELGANVNAYRAGCKAGTPLHHAAKRGLQETVNLLLSHGANALLMNDACQTPLDVARIKGYSNIVRAIESHICLFSGWLRELYGPGFLEVLAPQLLSRKVWVVVLPCGSRTLTNPFNLELAIYSSFQDAEPRTTIALWKANIEEPNFHRFDSTVTISDSCTIPKRKRHKRGFSSSRDAKSKFREVKQMRIKLAPEKDRDKQQLQQFCNACKGISQEMHPKFPLNTQASNVPAIAQATAPRHAEDAELAMAINASLPSHSSSAAHASNSWTGLGRPAPSSGSSSWWQIQEAHPSGNPSHPIQSHIVQTAFEIPPTAPALIPSAPLIEDEVMNDGPANYLPIDSSPVFLSYPTVENLPSMADKEDGGTPSCVICSDAPIEGACVPCGHMAGCMSCLSKIKAKKSGCPVCRAKIDRVIRLYAV